MDINSKALWSEESNFQSIENISFDIWSSAKEIRLSNYPQSLFLWGQFYDNIALEGGKHGSVEERGYMYLVYVYCTALTLNFICASLTD